MTIPRRTDQAGLVILGALLRLVFGTASDTPAAGDHDHSATGVGTSTTRLNLRGGLQLKRTDGGTGTYVMTAGDVYIGSPTGSMTAVTLLGAAPAGTIVFVGDEKGTASGTPIVITPASGTINGGGSVSVSTDHGLRLCVSDGTDWASYSLA